LDNRAAKGFTVVQTVAIPEFNGLTQPNAYGLLPLHHQNPATPNDAYFDFVDEVLDLAAERGLYVGFLPTWGAYALDEDHPLFPNPNVFTPTNARSYGEYLSGRFGNHKNVIWILGGDREPDTNLEVWRAMGTALHGKGQLVTYHPSGGHSSSRLLHGEPWLDFNLFQSGHSTLSRPDQMAYGDFLRTPVKPVINGEPSYEAIPNDFGRLPGTLDDREVRRGLYASLLSGAAGFTYGCNEVWMMWRPEIEPISDKVEPPFLGASLPWWEALDRPGAGQLRVAGEVLESLPDPFDRIPMWDRVRNNVDSAQEACYAAGTRNWLLVWTPGRAVDIESHHLGPGVSATWVCPCTGLRTLAKGGPEFVPPSDEDWLLLLQRA
jgi:hypothetical protein